MLASLFALASLPVFAAEAPRDPLDLSPQLLSPAEADAAALPGRTMFYAHDVRSLFAASPIAGAVRGYTPGVFDVFHVGHLNVINSSRPHCDHLIVGVVSDEVARQAVVAPAASASQYW